MSKYWSKLTSKIKPYTPGEQPQDKKYIKLNTNENPYPPSPEVLRVINNYDKSNLRLYPDPESKNLIQTIADYYKVMPGQIFVGNGSDEVLALSFLTFFEPERTILFPDITYSFYKVYCSLLNIDYKLVSVDNDFSLNHEDYSQNNNGIIFPNPNAPTGKYLEVDSVRKILDNNQESVVIVDEAYIDFGGESMVKFIDQYPNLLVIQTLSKSRSLAGMRIGYAVGQKHLIEGLNRIKNSFNSYPIDRIAAVAAAAAIKDRRYFQKTRQKILKTRNRVRQHLKDIGFKVIPSSTNFIFVSHKEYQADYLFKTLKDEGILVRYFNQPRIDNYLRISIGKDNEMDVFVRKLKDIIGR
ncbi:MAG: histidinol-phosphate transaminase [Halanaerobiales bacterium]